MKVLYTPPKGHRCDFPDKEKTELDTIVACEVCLTHYMLIYGDYGKQWWPITQRKAEKVMRKRRPR